jgi:hypothetical protein
VVEFQEVFEDAAVGVDALVGEGVVFGEGGPSAGVGPDGRRLSSVGCSLQRMSNFSWASLRQVGRWLSMLVRMRLLRRGSWAAAVMRPEWRIKAGFFGGEGKLILAARNMYCINTIDTHAMKVIDHEIVRRRQLPAR